MRLSIYLVLSICLCLCPASFGHSTRPAVAQYNLEGAAPYLVAHYMMWFTTPWSTDNHSPVDRTTATWAHWGWQGKGTKHDPDKKGVDGKRDIASILYPRIGPYDSGSRAVIRYHLATMKAAGISAVSSLWYGPGSNTDTRVPMLLDEAQKLQMRVFICYEEKLNFQGYRHPATRQQAVDSAANDLSYILRTYSQHPAYLRRNDVPIIQQFNGYGKDPVVGDRNYTPQEWQTIFARLPGKVEYLRQNLDESYYPTIQAAYVWWDPGKWPRQFADRAAVLRDQGRLDFFMAMVCPGFNDTGVWGWGDGPRVSKGYGLDVLDGTTQQALRQNPELVQLVTWNDFNEGTCFEPTVQYGTRFLETLGAWWRQSTGKDVHLDQLGAALDQYKRECSAQERAEIP